MHNKEECDNAFEKKLKQKPKLNLNKIKNITDNIENNNKKKLTVASIEKKRNIVIKKLNNKIKTDIAKFVMEYQITLNRSENTNLQGKLNALYYVILNNINSNL